VPFSLRNISTFGWDTSAVQVGCSKYEGQLALRFDGVVCSVLSVNARFAAGAESGATFSGAKVPLRSPMSLTVSSFGLSPSLLKPMTAHFWSGSAHSHDNSVINTKQVGQTHKHTFGMDHLVLGVVDVVITLNKSAPFFVLKIDVTARSNELLCDGRMSSTGRFVERLFLSVCRT
jgi:hypothetical protein